MAEEIPGAKTIEETEMVEGFYKQSEAMVDADVEAEKRRIAALCEDGSKDDMPLLIIEELKKIYPSRSVPAVDGISVGIPKGSVYEI